MAEGSLPTNRIQAPSGSFVGGTRLPSVAIRSEFIERVIVTLKTSGAALRQDGPRHHLTINDNLNVRLSIVRCCASKRCNT
jgi:hypothetical protein